MLFLGMANAYIMRTNMSVAIVAMAAAMTPTAAPEPGGSEDGEYVWDAPEQSIILSSFFYGYVVTQIPFGILAKRFGAKYFLGVGMLINSVFGLLVPLAASQGEGWMIAVRFVQGLGEGPIVPCTHAMLSNWIPPTERSKLGAFVYAGAQLGTVISLPLSGLLSRYGFAGGWPSIFYVFGAVGALWSLGFLFTVYEDPDCHPTISDPERDFINRSKATSGPVEQAGGVPWKSILTSLPFWGILAAHMGQNYGYETLLTQLPTFMKQILHFNIKDNGILSALPYLCMWIFSNICAFMADWLIWKRGMTATFTRKLLNAIGLVGPAVCMIGASYTGCSSSSTVALLSMGVGLMGATMSAYRINHLDISPRYAGVLMAITNCVANIFALLAPLIAGYITDKRTQQAWREVFFVSAGVYFVTAAIYQLFASGEKQSWDSPPPKIMARKASAVNTDLGLSQVVSA
ncbi:hypothetical protein ONE63_009810 [Megalurothrips usitatus]|uniref:Putative inorganic phosphate cotransporter n=1 Tax=Megalurothrips usitatus TaxID=439358 RepID=A0AAV7XK07_9NEOP|nr:hypothetical protein ONE63_009810 [Megalurothrips usitatus]